MPPRSRTPASCARACSRARRSSGCGSTSPSATSRSRPIATVVGLAFRMFDPDKLLGDKRGPRHHLRADSARHAGHHHRPPALPAQRSVPERPDAGQGRVRAARLHHRRPEDGRPGLAHAGRAALGGPLHLAAVERHGRREGGRVGHRARTRASAASSTCRSASSKASRPSSRAWSGYTYTMDAARSVTAGAIDGGEKPSVPSAMLKYHVTEMGRQVANDAMDVHGGKGICLGPRNYLGRGYQVVPVAITVEGANILTRNLIIFGQGAIRCHPFVLQGDERGAQSGSQAGRRRVRPRAVRPHRLHHLATPCARSSWRSRTRASRACRTWATTKRYYQHIVRFSASFAFAVDVAMLTLGGYLKKKENLSARLGDVLSCMYLASMVLKHHENQGRPDADLPIVEWACRNLLYKRAGAAARLPAQLPESLPRRASCALLIFPRGRTYSAPSDRLGRTLADAGAEPDAKSRDRLCRFVYQHARAGQSARPAAGSAGAVADRRAHREAHPRRRREDRQGHRARPARADHAGARAPASSPRPRRRCCATTIARSWTSSTSTTSRRTSWRRRRSSPRDDRRQRQRPFPSGQVA